MPNSPVKRQITRKTALHDFSMDFCQPSVIQLVQRLDTGLDALGSILGREPYGSPNVLTNSKSAGAWSWSLTSIWCRGKKNRCIIPLHLQYAFMADYFINHKENFIFAFIYANSYSNTATHFSI
jgi:hypothetical protein